MNQTIDLYKPFLFRDTKSPIPADMRPLWRISIILLILKLVSRSNKASINKLHVISSVLRSQDKKDVFLNVLNKEQESSDLVVRFDPTLNRAIEIARAEKLIDIDNGKNVYLTDKGLGFCTRILDDDELLIEEKNFLNEFKANQLSEKIIDAILGMKEL